MLTQIYIEALLIDTQAADNVYELWACGLIGDFLTVGLWLTIICRGRGAEPM